MSTATKKSAGPGKPSGGRGDPSGFAASVIHYRTGKRIYPKTAKAFPLFGRRKQKEPCPEQLLLPLPSDPSVVAVPEPEPAAPEPSPPPPPSAPRKRVKRTPRH